MNELKEPKLYIMTTNKVSGIYTITNKTTGRLYIGESLDIYRRWHDEHIPPKIPNQLYICQPIASPKSSTISFWNAVIVV